MATQDVNLPDIGEGVTEGELVQWLVAVGDTVEIDQAVAEVMTDKATVEVPTTVAGVVTELVVGEGDIVPIETCMLKVDSSGAASAAAPKPEAVATPLAPTAAPAMAVASHSPAPVEINPPVADASVLATPGTRRLARESGVDINGISGTGLAGRVTREDVLQIQKGVGAVAAGRPQVQSPIQTPAIPIPSYQGSEGQHEDRVPLRGIRRKIAQTMQMTKQIVPHFTIMDEANITELVKVRTEAKAAAAKYGVNVTYLPFVMKALVATMREFEKFNASIDDAAEEIVYKRYFNIGFAADTPNGLLVPVVKDVDKKSLLQVSQEIIELGQKARDGKITSADMKGATITITNIGSIGGTYATPIINHPEVAILGMYKMTDKPVMKDGKFRAAKVMNYSMTCDHRLIDGAEAARFLAALIERIENPSRLFLDMV